MYSFKVFNQIKEELNLELLQVYIEQFFNQMKHYIKLDKPNTFTALDESIKTSIDKIKEEHYKHYFIYAYNKDYYKNKQIDKKYTRRRTLKIYKSE